MDNLNYFSRIFIYPVLMDVFAKNQRLGNVVLFRRGFNFSPAEFNGVIGAFPFHIYNYSSEPKKVAVLTNFFPIRVLFLCLCQPNNVFMFNQIFLNHWGVVPGACTRIQSMIALFGDGHSLVYVYLCQTTQRSLPRA